MYTQGPSVMEVEGLKDRVNSLKESIDDLKPTTYEAAMKEKREREKAETKQPNQQEIPTININRSEVEKPYEVVGEITDEELEGIKEYRDQDKEDNKLDD